MIYLIKSLFRYTFKNKLSTILLTILSAIGVFLLLALSLLSNNLNTAYDKLVTEGNLGNIVINENYSTKVQGEPSLTDEQAKAINEEKFKTYLKTLPDFQFRQFESLDYTNTANGKAMKVIAYNNNYDVDKLVIYEGNGLYDDTFDFNALVAEGNWTSTTPEAQLIRREIVYLATKAYWTDDEIGNLFNGPKNTSAISLLTAHSDPTDPLYDPMNWTTTPLKKYIQCWFDKSQPNYRPLLSKGYRLNFEVYVSGVKPKVIGNIINYGSQFAVVPDYVLQDQNKKMIPNEWYQEIKKYLSKDTYLNETEFENRVMSMIPEECKVYVDSLPYVVVGTGITPDFMYPVYSFERITPNIHEEALLYTTQGGFDNALNANRSNPVDSYIVAKYQGKNTKLSTEIANINKEIPKYMTTAGQTWAFAADDPNNTMQPTAVRLLFLPKLVEIQIVISNTLSIFILVLGIIIFIIMLKKFIKDNQVSLAILRSNGYQKRSIIWSTSLFAIIPCFIGGWLGYLIAWLTQNFAISIYSFYWVIPTSISAFSIPLLLGAIFIPFIILATVCVTTTTAIIKRPPGRLMNESSKFTVSRFSKFVVRPFPKMNILSKFRCSIAFSSMSRLIVLMTMLSLSSTGLIFAFGSSGKFEQTKQITYVDKHYNMNFELETPTLQGGQYFRSTFENAGKPIFDDKKQLLNFNVSSIDKGGALQGFPYLDAKGLDKSINDNTPITDLWSYFRGDKSTNLNTFGQVTNDLIPSMNDGTWQVEDINYLKNKMSTQIFTDANAAGNNPWDIARSLAPENVQNYSKKLTKQLMQTAFNDSTIYFTPDVLKDFPTWSTFGLENKTIKQILLETKTVKEVPDDLDPTKIIFQDDETKKYYTLNSTASTFMNSSVNPSFLAVFGYLMTVPTEKHYSDLFYKLIYDDICMDEDDETYTYVNSKAISGINDNEPIKLIGIKPDSKKVQLKNDNEENFTI